MTLIKLTILISLFYYKNIFELYYYYVINFFYFYFFFLIMYNN